MKNGKKKDVYETKTRHVFVLVKARVEVIGRQLAVTV